LEVNRSSYYDWRKIKPGIEQAKHLPLAHRIKDLFIMGRCNYGSRRIKQLLAREQLLVSRRRIGRLMKAQGLVCKARRRHRVTTTDSRHSLPIAPNRLNRQFNPAEPNQCYAGDITYIPTQEGWLYLAVAIDLFSRQVVGWSMADSMRAELVNDALLMALWQRKPQRGLIWHTDRGSQYASDSHRALLKDYGIIQSMSRKGNCWDNAVSESFFHTLKVELIHGSNFETKEEAKQAIFEYIEVFYNRIRIHSGNDYLSPVEYERRRKAV
jgi:putative transposase